jgi:hypothetical protein
MSKGAAKVSDRVRIWVKVTHEVRKELRHLAIDLDGEIERVGGDALAKGIDALRREQQPKSGKR